MSRTQKCHIQGFATQKISRESCIRKIIVVMSVMVNIRQPRCPSGREWRLRVALSTPWDTPQSGNTPPSAGMERQTPHAATLQSKLQDGK